MRFEKWQALGNDYVIVEHDALPFALSPERVRALCAPHTGVGADGVLELSRSDEPGFVASLRIFNPDGSEAELSGNGAREAILYLRRAGWTDASTFSIQTAAGEIRPTITGETTCTVDMGRATLRSKDFPSGGDDGTETVDWWFDESKGLPVEIGLASRTPFEFYRTIEESPFNAMTVVIRTRGAKSGKYKILLNGICYQLVVPQLDDECFVLTLCAD
jgi:diaminopimelate epimerase